MDKRQAFTLIEILVVLAIITIMLAVGIPFLRGGSQRMRLKSALRGSISLLNYARAEAISRRRWVKVDLKDNCLVSMIKSGENWDDMDRTYCFPKGLDVQWQGINAIVFFPSGEAESAGCIEIANDTGKHCLVCVSSLSGKVFVK